MILAVVGLQREARIVAGDGVRVVTGGADAKALADQLEQTRRDDLEGVISIGIAGALAPALRPGDVVVGAAVRDGRRKFSADPAWMKQLMSRLPQATGGIVAGSDAILPDAEAKAALHGATGAVAVDMESHITARFADRHGLPLAVLRVVSDAADQTLPAAARLGLRPDGAVNLRAVLRALAADPRQLPALVRTGLEAEKGFAALLRCHHLLGPRLGFRQLGDHGLDVT
jgi:hopanoid-associated phosphorylase